MATMVVRMMHLMMCFLLLRNKSPGALTMESWTWLPAKASPVVRKSYTLYDERRAHPITCLHPDPHHWMLVLTLLCPFMNNRLSITLTPLPLPHIMIHAISLPYFMNKPDRDLVSIKDLVTG
jgi:hypothetical protein